MPTPFGYGGACAIRTESSSGHQDLRLALGATSASATWELRKTASGRVSGSQKQPGTPKGAVRSLEGSRRAMTADDTVMFRLNRSRSQLPCTASRSPRQFREYRPEPRLRVDNTVPGTGPYEGRVVQRQARRRGSTATARSASGLGRHRRRLGFPIFDRGALRRRGRQTSSRPSSTDVSARPSCLDNSAVAVKRGAPVPPHPALL